MKSLLMFMISLTAGASILAQSPISRAEQWKVFLKEYAAAEDRFNRDFSDPGDDLLRIIARYDGWPGWDFMTRALDSAEVVPEDQVALDACQWVIERGRNVGVEDKRSSAAEDRAWSLIEKHHLQDARIADLCTLAGEYRSPRRERFLRLIQSDERQPREIRGLATLALSEFSFSRYTAAELKSVDGRNRSEFSQWLSENRKDPVVDDEVDVAHLGKCRREALALYQVVVSEFGDVGAGSGRGSARGLGTLGERAVQRIFAIENLSIGSQVPEIDGTDLNGQPLKLSSFRGKVVLLTFWFTGCGPCMGMLPQEKQLVENFSGQPFQMLSVCNDPKVEEGRATALDKEMNWPNWFDGSPWVVGDPDSKDPAKVGKTSGPIAKQWNVRGWPTIYVIDAAGVIRAKYLRGEALDAKVQELVSEAISKAPAN
jgi:thiol-disulfide isomerase/thioredoxin